MIEKSKPNNPWHARLWGVQIVLAVSCATYTVKIFMPISELAKFITWADDVPSWLVRFTGGMEGLAAIGFIAPALTRIWPFMTVVTAAAFAVLQVLAIAFHIMRAEIIIPLPGNVLLLSMSLFVLWGRLKLAPISALSRK